MSETKLGFVSFKEVNTDTYIAYLTMEHFLSSNKDMESILENAANVYNHSLRKMQNVINKIDTNRKKRAPVRARHIWELGEEIFQMVEKLQLLSLQIDSIYEHLERELGVKRKWLEKVIIFRRYISDESKIPESLNWGKCEKGTRRIAEGIQKGILPR